MPIQIAEEFHRPRRVALRARRTSRRRRDSEEPRVEMAKTRGLRRWAAARRVAVWWVDACLGLAGFRVGGCAELSKLSPVEEPYVDARGGRGDGDNVSSLFSMRIWRMRTPATRSAKENNIFPNAGCSHSLGASRTARSGVYR
jgi:hypothetical protein